MADYKIHMFQHLGNGKLHPSRSQCGRALYRNYKGTHTMKTKYFLDMYKIEPSTVCSKCLQWALDNNLI